MRSKNKIHGWHDEYYNRFSRSFRLENITYPLIKPVEGDERPFWSVMIPTYNSKRYLEQTLRSVLDQALEVEQMQIEVVDDCSTESPEALVQSLGQGRISYYRNPQNVGLIGNWNTCIQRAKGQWVHILHQDDLILPGFYQKLRALIESNPSVGAVFSRCAFIDEDDHWKMLSPIERRTPGILSNWLEKIAVLQLIQFPSIVVKRSVYETLGGFCFEAHYAADWEMWKRVSAYYPIGYEPQILACYRSHSASESSRLLRSGSNIIDTRKAIEIAKSYLPQESVQDLSRQANQYCAWLALTIARELLAENDWVSATSQVKEGLRCDASIKTVMLALPLVKSIAKRQVIGFYRSRKKWNTFY